MKLYHVTKLENVESILKDGLLRCHGDYKSAFICLSEKPDSWIQDGLVLLEVDIDGIGSEVRSWGVETDEINVWGDIPPERIRVVENEQTRGEPKDS